MSKSAVKLGIAVVCFVLAGVLWVTLRPVKEVPKVAEDAKLLDFVCTKCGHHSQHSPEEVQAASPAQRAGSSDGEQRVRGGRGAGRKPTTLKCPECGEHAAVAASRCPEHGTYFPQVADDGSRGKCPKCP